MSQDEIQPETSAQTLDFADPVNALPLYQCHKQVRALKIGRILHIDPESGVVEFEPEDDTLGIEMVVTRPGWLARFEGAIDDDDLGYWVQYKDGFSSWSPTEAFKDGYSRL